MDSSLASGSLTGRSFTLKTPLPVGADLRPKILSGQRRKGLKEELLEGKTTRVLPCSGAPPWGPIESIPLDQNNDPTPLGWRDSGTGVLRFFYRIESRSVPTATAVGEAEVLAQSRHRRSLIDLAPKARKSLIAEAKAMALGRVEPKVNIVEGYVLQNTLWCGHSTAHEHPELFAALVQTFGPLFLRPGIAISLSGGWDAIALSVLAVASKAPGGHLGEGVHVRSVSMADANVRIDTKSAALPLSGLLQELLTRRPLPKVHRIGFSVLQQGNLREVDVDIDGVTRVVPAPSTAGLWPDRILRRHQEAESLIARVSTAMERARDSLR